MEVWLVCRCGVQHRQCVCAGVVCEMGWCVGRVGGGVVCVWLGVVCAWSWAVVGNKCQGV